MGAGSVTVGVKADSSQFRADMVKNQATVKEFAQYAQGAGKTAAGAMRGAAAESVVLSQGLVANTQAATALASAMGVVRTALMTAFPIFGALAVLEVMEKLANNKFAQVAVEISNGFRSINLSAENSIDNLKLSTAKMQEQVDLLSGKRPNTLAEDLANAALAADKLAMSLDADNRKIKQLLEQERLTAFQGLFTDRAGTADVEGSIKSFEQDLAHLAATYQHAVRTGSPDAGKDLQALNDKQEAAMKWQQDQLTKRQQLQNQKTGPNQDANIAVLTGFGDTLIDQRDLQLEEKNNKATASQLKKLEDDKKFASMQSAAHRKQQEELLRADEEEEKRENAHNKLTINEEIQFWNDRIGAFTRGSEQYIAVQDKIYDLIAKRPSLFAENKKNQAATGKSQVQGNDILAAGADALRKIDTQQVDRSAKSLEKYNEEIERGNAIQQRAGTVFAESSIQMAVAQGTMSRLDAAQAMAAVHAQDHADSLKRINAALAEQIRLINAMPADKMSSQDKEDAIRVAQQSSRNQVSALDGNFAVTRQRDAANVQGATIAGAVKDSLNLMVQSFTDMASHLKDVIPRTIEGLNDDIAKLATGQGRRGDFGRTLLRGGQGLIKTGLEGAEGHILGMLGLGKSTPGSSVTNPSYTVIVGGGAGTGVGGGTSVGLGSILGKLPGIGQFIQPFSGLLPHFAAGGDVLANHPIMVGENGPEPFIPHTNGTILPHHMIGGGGDSHVYHVDARGSNDPMAVQAAVARAIPHAVAASVQANHQAKMRSPGGR